MPSSRPTYMPTMAPTSPPTVMPTYMPTHAPTMAPTTKVPTYAPTMTAQLVTGGSESLLYRDDTMGADGLQVKVDFPILQDTRCMVEGRLVAQDGTVVADYMETRAYVTQGADGEGSVNLRFGSADICAANMNGPWNVHVEIQCRDGTRIKDDRRLTTEAYLVTDFVDCYVARPTDPPTTPTCEMLCEQNGWACWERVCIADFEAGGSVEEKEACKETCKSRYRTCVAACR